MYPLGKWGSAPSVYFGQVSIKEEDPITDELKEFEDVEFRVHRKCEEAWGEDPLWYNEET